MSPLFGSFTMMPFFQVGANLSSSQGVEATEVMPKHIKIDKISQFSYVFISNIISKDTRIHIAVSN